MCHAVFLIPPNNSISSAIMDSNLAVAEAALSVASLVLEIVLLA
jgi:hypothetical protein